MAAAALTSFPKGDIKILLLENVHPSALEEFSAEGFQIERVARALGEDELVERIHDVHLLGIRSKTRLTPRVLDAGRRLLAVGCFCIGTSQVNTVHANARGVPVFNAPFSNTRSVAEMVLGEILVLSRQLFDRSREMHEGTWKKVAVGSHEVRGKTLGIVGYGHIGRQVGVLAEGLGLRVVFHDTGPRLPMGNNRAVHSLDELLPVADFVTLHVPETPKTRGLIGAEQLALMKKEAILINASRGSVVDIEALASALRTGALAGAAVDVFPDEPEGNSGGFATPLRGLPNVLLTPHIGGSTEEAQEAIGREVAGSLTAFVNLGTTTGAVNFPQAELPQPRGTHRILNVHRNVPGVMRDITRIVSDRGANIHSQILTTDPEIGYLILDLDDDVSHEVRDAIAALPTSVKTRLVYA